MELDANMTLTADSLDGAFRRVEAAIDAHSKLKRVANVLGEPDVSLSRLGCTVHIAVRLKGSRKKPFKIHGEGSSVEAAVEHLINGLDHWAEALA